MSDEARKPWEPTEEELNRLWEEILFRQKLEQMSTREFVDVLLNEVWARLPSGSEQSNIVDIAIRRLRVVAAREIKEARRRERDKFWPDVIL